MKRFWKLVSVKDLVFGTVIFAIVGLMTVVQSADKVKVTFGEESMDVKTAKYAMNIPYDMIDTVDIMDMPDRGEVVDGADDMAVRTGMWKNDAWGEYYVCADLKVSKCIVMHLNNDSVFVVSRKDVEETQFVYDTLCSYLK